jgi:hypothetical protein
MQYRDMIVPRAIRTRRFIDHRNFWSNCVLLVFRGVVTCIYEDCETIRLGNGHDDFMAIGLCGFLFMFLLLGSRWFAVPGNYCTSVRRYYWISFAKSKRDDSEKLTGASK